MNTTTIKRGAIAAALALAAISSHADLIVGAHLATAHTSDGLQDVNPGVYVQDQATGIGAGIYYNSFKRVSAHVSRAFCTDSGIWCVNVGAITGYKLPVIPLVVPNIRIGLGGGFAVRTMILPQTGFTGDGGGLALGGIHFAVEKSL